MTPEPRLAISRRLDVLATMRDLRPFRRVRLFRRRKKSSGQEAAVYHIAALLDEGVMSVDQLLAAGIWADFPGDPADVERFLRQVAEDPKTSDADRHKIERHLEQLHKAIP